MLFPFFPLRRTLLCACLSGALSASGKGTAAYEIRFRDSVLLEDKSRILSTPLHLKNTGSSRLQLGILFRIPPHWKPLGALPVTTPDTLLLEGHAEKKLPLGLLRTQGVNAGWDRMEVLVWNLGQTDTTAYPLHLHVVEKPAFSLEATNAEQFFSGGENPGTVALAVRIKNTGNIRDSFRIAGNAGNLSFRYQEGLVLAPGQDTTLTPVVPIAPRIWRDLSRETIPFSVTSAFSGKEQQAYFRLRKVGSLLNLPPPARREIPMTFGGGLMVNGDRLSYFGQFNTAVQLGNHYVGFSYRSRQLGDAINSFQRNAFNLTYSHKGFQLQAGQIAPPRNFYTFGQGASLRYRQGNATFLVAALKHNELGQGFTNPYCLNDNLYAAADYKIQKLAVSQQLESNFNEAYGLNSYLFHNEVTLSATEQFRLRFFGGLGMEYKTRAPDTLSPFAYGWAGGYEWKSRLRKWRLNSTIRYRSCAYPGIFQGLHYQQHEVFREVGKFYFGPAFYYNGVERNTLRDTLYNTDYLSINSLKTGLSAGYQSGRVAVGVGLGQLRQLGRVYTYGKARYADVNLTARLPGKTELRLIANNAFVPFEEARIFSTNTQVQVSGNQLGFSGFYNRLPNLSDGRMRLYETVVGGPSYTRTFFKQALFASVRYSLAKTLTEDHIRHGIGAQISLNGIAGISLSINGFLPLQNPDRTDLPLTETRFGNLFLTKKIGIRTGKRTDFDLKVILFVDANNNRLWDAGETRLRDLLFAIDNEMLLTDQEGSARCLHLREGPVKLSFLNTKTAGLVPVGGAVQTTLLTKDETLYVAFKEGRKISGKVRIENDSMSHNGMTAGNLKIIITDTFGTRYHALTDKHGDFACFVPEGHYQVGLNAEIFEGTSFMPQQMQFEVDLSRQKETSVQFVIAQKKRKVRFLKD